MKFPYSFPLTRAFCLYLGQLALLLGETFSSIFAGRIRWRLVLHQIVEIGFGSQAVVIITGIFTGAVFTAQIFFQFNALNMSTAVGPVVSIAMFRELGPVLTGLMVAGRVGAAMSAEIGTMKVTEQIDALRALAVNPVDYLVVPRAVAMMISMPLLVGECIFFSLSASYFVATTILNVNSVFFLQHMWSYTHNKDMVMATTPLGWLGSATLKAARYAARSALPHVVADTSVCRWSINTSRRAATSGGVRLRCC